MTRLSASQFRLSLTKLLPLPPAGVMPSKPYKVALAVSGGVDSMALASLCKELEHNEPGLIESRAFVVDHQVREGSFTEAQKVVENLTSMGMSAEILRLAKLESVSKITNLESQLRRARFQALGTACSRANIDSLLVAHHKDDIAETTLMRIVKHQVGDGLHGIRSKSDIPECYGIYGVHRSSLDESQKPQLDESRGLKYSMPESCTKAGVRVGLATGGVKVCRPLLGFFKHELVERCKQQSVPWVDDETNRDRTLTMRNAIRHLLQSNRLPKALETQSLLRLSSTIRARIEKREEAANAILRASKIGAVDLRAGTRQTTTISYRGKGRYDARAVENWARYLQILTEPISPMADTTLTSFVEAATIIGRASAGFATLVNTIRFTDDTSSRMIPMRFTVAGVQIDIDEFSSRMARNLMFTMTRQVVPRQERPASFCWIDPKDRFTDPANPPKDSIAVPPGSWVLWDGRYWISATSKRGRPIMVIGVQSVFSHYVKTLDEQTQKDIREALKSADPVHLNPTLPILVVARLQNKFVALPTMGIVNKHYEDDVTWQVKFKSAKS